MSQDRGVPRLRRGAPSAAGGVRGGRSPLRLTSHGGHVGAPMLNIGILIVGLVIVAALAAPLLATTDPIDQDLAAALKPPFWLEDGSLQHPLGTDHLGRDVYSRLIYGARISLTISALAALLGAVVGVAAGLIAGYVGG